VIPRGMRSSRTVVESVSAFSAVLGRDVSIKGA
jgi:hypothetical protein